jgi:hypothetical protein
MNKGDKIEYCVTLHGQLHIWKGEIIATKTKKRSREDLMVYVLYGDDEGNTGGTWMPHNEPGLRLYYEAFADCDVTPLSHPDHHAVGKEFLGTNWYSRFGNGNTTVRWFCAAHDRQGYWMFATDGSGTWTNVSERAIGASFHEVLKQANGRLSCRFAPVPAYDHSKLHNDQVPVWLGRPGGALTIQYLATTADGAETIIYALDMVGALQEWARSRGSAEPYSIRQMGDSE